MWSISEIPTVMAGCLTIGAKGWHKCHFSEFFTKPHGAAPGKGYHWAEQFHRWRC